jgi:hypothetical protein
MNTNSVVGDFFIQCDINFVCVWDGEKASLKLPQSPCLLWHQTSFPTFLQFNDSTDLRLFYRKLCIGRSLRDSVAAGFSNLSSCRAYSFDLFSDSMVFGFGNSFNRKFSLLVDGDFSPLDGLLGGKWDIKLGKDENSFLNMQLLLGFQKARFSIGL